MQNSTAIRIETARLVLRPFTEADALNWIQWPQGKCNDREPAQVLAIELKDGRAVIGLAGVAPKRELSGEIEVLFSVADEHQRRGYATEAAKAIVWWAFEKAGQDMLCAIVKPENAASRRVIDKLGFVYCDTRTLPHNGADCAFDCFRFYRTDSLPAPEWDIRDLYKPEPMGGFFDARVESYDDHMLSGGRDENYRKFGGFMPKTDGAIQILDIGCGTGIELDHIWARAPRAHITCVDMSRGMLDALLKNHPGRHGQIAIVEASYVDWAYPEGAFDLIVSSNTMHHLWPDEKVAVYRKLLGALKPGACYVENDFIVDAAQSEQYRRRYEIITASLPAKAKPGEYHIDIPLTLEAQQKLLLDAGFRSVEVLEAHIKPSGSGAILRAEK